jgi:ATP synthase protein I
MDKRLEGTQSWTLTFLIVGLVIGCMIAWFWLSKEHKEIHKEDNNE